MASRPQHPPHPHWPLRSALERAAELALLKGSKEILTAARSVAFDEPTTFLAVVEVVAGEDFTDEKAATALRDAAKFDDPAGALGGRVRAMGFGEAGSASRVARSTSPLIDALNAASASIRDDARFALCVALSEAGALPAFAAIFEHVLKRQDYSSVADPVDRKRTRRDAVIFFLLGRRDFTRQARRLQRTFKESDASMESFLARLGRMPAGIETWEARPGNALMFLALTERIEGALVRLEKPAERDFLRLGELASGVEGSPFAEAWEELRAGLAERKQVELYERYSQRARLASQDRGVSPDAGSELGEGGDPVVAFDAHCWKKLLVFLDEGAFERAREAANREATKAAATGKRKPATKAKESKGRARTAGKTPMEILEEAFDALATGDALGACDRFLKLAELRIEAFAVLDGDKRSEGPFWFPALLAGVIASAGDGLPESWSKRFRPVEGFEANAAPYDRTLVFLCSIVNLGEPESTYRALASRRVAEMREKGSIGFYAPLEGGEARLAGSCAGLAAIAFGMGGSKVTTTGAYRWLEALSHTGLLRDGERPPFAFLLPENKAQPVWAKQIARVEDVLGVSTGEAVHRTGSEDPSAPRLCWRLDVEGESMRLAPLEQSFSRKRWSAPKHVALARLVQSSVRRAYALEPADVELLACARNSVPDGGWRKEWNIPWDAAFDAIARHPRVVTAGADGLRPAKVSLVKPALLLLRDSDGFSFEVPHSGLARGWVWWWRADGDLAVARLDERASKAIDILSSVRFPDDGYAHVRVREFLGKLGGHFELAFGGAPERGRGVGRERGNSNSTTESEDLFPGAVEVDRSPLPLTLRVERSSWGADTDFFVSVAVKVGGERGRALPGDEPRAFLSRTAEGRLCWIARDLERERESLQRLRVAWEHAWAKSGYGFRLGTWEELAHLLDFVSASNGAYEVEWPDVDRPLVSTLDHVVFKAPEGGSLDGGVAGWFQPGERTARLLAEKGLSLDRLRETVRATKESFVALDGGGVLALGEKVKALLETLSLLGVGEGKANRRGENANTLSAAGLFAVAQAHPEAFEDAGAIERAFRETHSALRDMSALPFPVASKLRGYQTEGVEWIHSRWAKGLGCCLADDMGLGKTLQAIAALELVESEEPALVVCPTSVVGNWLSELERFGSRWNARPFPPLARDAFVATLRAGDLVVVSYQSLERNKVLFEGRAWAALVLDEAQMLKNADAKRTAAVASVRSAFRIALSGTPVENRIEEIHSLMDVLNPGLFGSAAAFRRKFGGGPTAGVAAGERKALGRVLRPFLLRRTRERVLVELPERVEETRLVAMNDEERLKYEAFRTGAIRFLEGPDVGARDRFKIFTWLLRLRQACSHPVNLAALASEGDAGVAARESGHPEDPMGSRSAKEQELLDLLAENRTAGRKTLVFSQFLPTLGRLHSVTRAEGYRASLYVGGTAREERDALVEDFQRGEGEVLFMSLRAGGLGVNLTEADCVVHFDPWWNPALEAQATARAHRMGRRGTVHVVRLCYSDSVEEKMIALHEQKRQLSEDLLGGKAGEPGLAAGDADAGLSIDDVKALLADA